MLYPLTHRKGVPGRATIVEMGALDRGGGALSDEESSPSRSGGCSTAAR
jgi:hypothetical protein